MTDSRNRSSQRATSGKAQSADQAARAAKRKKKKRAKRMMSLIILLVLVVVIIFLAAFVVKYISDGKTPAATESTLTICDDGSLILEEVSDFDEDIYSKKELKKYTSELIDSFNDTYGSEVVKLEKLKVKDDAVYMKTTYETAGEYEMFSSYSVFVSSVSGAIAAGYDFNDSFAEVVAGKKLSTFEYEEAATAFGGYKVVIIDENITVVVPGEIAYVSSGNTTVVDSSTVKIYPDDGNVDASSTVYIIYQ